MVNFYRESLAFVCLTSLVILTAGCRGPVADPHEAAAPTTEVASALPPATADSAAPMAVIDAPETGEAAEPAQVVATGQPAAEATGPDVGSEVEAPAAPEAAAPNREEGPVTFKSASLHGAPTASGEPFDKDAMTAAHKTLPFGTVVTVTNLFNGIQTTVTINDRLPAHVSAVLDLSPAAAAEIDMIDAGIVEGRIEW